MLLKKSPLFLPLFCGLFAAVLVVGSLGLSQLKLEQKLARDQYGNNLVLHLSQQAQNAALNRDLISLRVIAEQALKSADVSSVRVFGIDTKVLAQAGEHYSHAKRPQNSYSHAINIEDSVAGYITITTETDTAQGHFYYAFWLLLGLSFGGCVASWYWRPEAESQSKEQITPQSKQSTAQPTEEIGAWLMVQSGNLARLQQQLSAEALNQLLTEFNQQLESVLNLYQGKLLWVDGNSFHCGFITETSGSSCAVSNAICSTKLLLELGRTRAGVKLHFKAAILPPAKGSNYSELFTAYKASHKQRGLLQEQADGTMLISQSLLQQSDMDRHLELSSTHLPDTQIIDQIKPAYSKLLNEQLKTLSQH